jgi:hypothetical protein
MLYADPDHAGMAAMAADAPGSPTSGHAGVPERLLGPAHQAHYTLTLREYWRLVDRTYTQVPQSDGYTKFYDVTGGVSTTNSQSLSAELEVGVGGDLSEDQRDLRSLGHYHHRMLLLRELQRRQPGGRPDPGLDALAARTRHRRIGQRQKT